MKNMMHLGNVNVAAILLELKNNPQLWNEHTVRTQDPTSPHHGLDDIWVRYQHIDKVKNDPQAHIASLNEPHESVWYPSINYLPSVKALAYEVMRMVKGERLGGILITRIHPGQECKRHIDTGSWHAAYYDKYAVQLESAPDLAYHTGQAAEPEQAFHFDGEHFCARQGDLYWFNNQEFHWVPNNSAVDRITIIFCIRTNKEDQFSK